MKERSLGLIVLLVLCLLIPSAGAAFSSLEETVSRRQSVKSYTSQNISGQQLLEVLQAAYGFWSHHRSIQRVGGDYSLTIYPVNATASYRYVPEDNVLVVHNSSVTKETIRPHIYQSYPVTASVVLIVVWNQTRMDNGYFASAEAGCLVQNVYLAAVSINLGTCCISGIWSPGIRDDLGLPNTMIPLLIMPLGYATREYPAASPNYDLMTGNLPLVQYSGLSFTDALNNMLYAQNWAVLNLSLQELSQLLWAAYGYTNITYQSSYHRTTPSANNIYPLVIYVSNATATYRYIPETHSVQLVQAGDKRLSIASACDGQMWAADAPAIFLIVYNSSFNGGNTGDSSDTVLPHEHIEVDAGCVVQQLLLEASAWNLSANIVSNGLEEWNGSGAEQIRSVLGLVSSLIPLYVVPVGHYVQPIYLQLIVDPEEAMYARGQSLSLTVNVFNQLNPALDSTLTLTVTGPGGYYDYDFQRINVAADGVGEYSFSWVFPNVGGTYVVEVSLIPPTLTAYDAAWLEAV